MTIKYLGKRITYSKKEPNEITFEEFMERLVKHLNTLTPIQLRQSEEYWAAVFESLEGN